MMRLVLALFGLVLTACGNEANTTDLGDREVAQPISIHNAAMVCSGCHAAGNEVLIGFSAYTPETLAAALATYRDDVNGTTVMHRIARGYSDDDIAEISNFLANAERTK